MSIAQQRITDFAPGEQEAVMQAAQAVGHTMLAEKRAKRRWWKSLALQAIILSAWAIVCALVQAPLIDRLMSWTFRMDVQIDPGVYFTGCMMSVVTQALLFFTGPSLGRYWENNHIQIKRLTISKGALTALIMLTGLQWWLLLTVRLQPSALCNMTGRQLFWVINSTDFMFIMLGYWMTYSALVLFGATKRQLLQEEKWALGIFD